MKRAEVLSRACESVDDVRLSRAATQHAIDQSRKSIAETFALLRALRVARDERTVLVHSPKKSRAAPKAPDYLRS